ncbi:hypothetical protein VTG60DRAFT_4424 [Thermothelomyces hinnuleus]
MNQKVENESSHAPGGKQPLNNPDKDVEADWEWLDDPNDRALAEKERRENEELNRAIDELDSAFKPSMSNMNKKR